LTRYVKLVISYDVLLSLYPPEIGGEKLLQVFMQIDERGGNDLVKGSYNDQHYGENIMKSALIALLLLVFAPFPVHAQETPLTGEMVDVGGYRIHLRCTGSDSPTVVIESGAGGNWLPWYVVQEELSVNTRVCTYDRAGNGLSDDAPMPRTLDQVVLELHTLLKQAGEAAPYLLVGHSIGGYTVPVYAATYPEEIVGIVLVDPTPMIDQIQPTFAQMMVLGPLMPKISRASDPEVITRVHMVRFEKLNIPSEVLAEMETLLPEIFSNTNLQGEIMLDQPEMREQVWTAYDSLPDVPVTVISARGSVADEIAFVIEMLEITDLTDEAKEIMVGFFQGQEDAKNVGQEKIAERIGAKLVLAEQSRHEIMLDSPLLIVGEVMEIITNSR
jgi:pimeloyl-ACP methyl ester carboxylesterase